MFVRRRWRSDPRSTLALHWCSGRVPTRAVGLSEYSRPRIGIALTGHVRKTVLGARSFQLNASAQTCAGSSRLKGQLPMPINFNSAAHAAEACVLAGTGLCDPRGHSCEGSSVRYLLTWLQWVGGRNELACPTFHQKISTASPPVSLVEWESGFSLLVVVPKSSMTSWGPLSELGLAASDPPQGAPVRLSR